MTTEFLELPIFSSSYPDQVVFIEQFKTLLQNISLEVRSNYSLPIMVESATQPNQASWEAAWVAAGNTLPIVPAAQFVWWDTANLVIGGSFGSTPTSNGTVYSRDTLYPPGGWNYNNSSELSSAVSTNVSLGAVPANHPYLDINLARNSDIFVSYELYISLSSGTGSWGIDFLYDGAKVGTQYYALPTNLGFVTANASGQMYCEAIIPNVPAGSHRIQALMGVVLSPVTPPTLAYGGLTTLGIRKLTVRAITL